VFINLSCCADASWRIHKGALKQSCRVKRIHTL
jgi:hypothetical protein